VCNKTNISLEKSIENNCLNGGFLTAEKSKVMVLLNQNMKTAVEVWFACCLIET
jgi:hypothetical protein